MKKTVLSLFHIGTSVSPQEFEENFYEKHGFTYFNLIEMACNTLSSLSICVGTSPYKRLLQFNSHISDHLP